MVQKVNARSLNLANSVNIIVYDFKTIGISTDDIGGTMDIAISLVGGLGLFLLE